MPNLIYNKAVYMPKSLFTIVKGKTFLLDYSEHAKEEMEFDKYGKFLPRISLTVTEKNLVELYSNELQGIYKLLLRNAYDSSLDVCHVIMPQRERAMVKTCWLCTKEDNHITLNRSVYATK